MKTPRHGRPPESVRGAGLRLRRRDAPRTLAVVRSARLLRGPLLWFPRSRRDPQRYRARLRWLRRFHHRRVKRERR